MAGILRQRVLGLDIGAHSVKAAEIVHTPFRGLEIGQLRTLPLSSADGNGREAAPGDGLSRGT